MTGKLTSNPHGKYNGKEAEYVLAALDSENPQNRHISWTQRFEEEFCRVMGVEYAIACNSGTSGLHAALAAAGVGPGDEVIMPALTVVMDAFAAIQVGATPVFADVDPATFIIDPADAKRKITPRTKAIIAVSLYGLTADMDPVMEAADERGIKVIEDSAQTMLGTYKGRMGGTLGHAGVFSFENKKHLSCGSEGGMIVTNDEAIAQRARKFAGIGYKHLTASAGRTSLALSTAQDPAYERFDTLGLNYRMTEVSAAIGLGQLERVSEKVEMRKKVACLFDDAIEGCAWMIKQTTPRGHVHSYYTYAVRYEGDSEKGLAWKEFYRRYLDMGGDGFYGACKLPYLEPVLRLEGKGRTGICPVAEALQPKLMQFKTNYRDLKEAEKKTEVLKKLIRSIM